MSDEIDPDAVSPWWPCPECGGIAFQPAFCVFERGRWVETLGDHEWVAFDPPAGWPTGVSADVRCVDCGHEFNIARHYGWPIAGEAS